MVFLQYCAIIPEQDIKTILFNLTFYWHLFSKKMETPRVTNTSGRWQFLMFTDQKATIVYFPAVYRHKAAVWITNLLLFTRGIHYHFIVCQTICCEMSAEDKIIDLQSPSGHTLINYYFLSLNNLIWKSQISTEWYCTCYTWINTIFLLQ